MTAGQRWAVVFGSTLVLWGISERIFWSLIRPDDMQNPLLLVVSIIPYLVATYCVFLAIEYFKVSTLPGVLLMGALFGWITEGIVAMTAYGSEVPFPLSLSWTGLSWHMLLSVGVVWWWHRLVMAKSFMQSLLFSAGIGVFWGLWSMTWFMETPPVTNSVPEYIIHAFGITLLMIAGHSLLGRQVTMFRAPKIEKGIMLAIVAAFYLVTAITYLGPIALLIPFLAAVLYVPLRRNRARFTEAGVLATLTQRVPLRNRLTLLITPVVATAFYVFELGNPGVIFPFNLGVLFVTLPLGFAVFGWAWWKMFRAVPAPAPVATEY